MSNSKSIQGIIVLILGLFLSIWLGLSIVTNQTETILQIIAAAAFIICLGLGKKIWLLVPFMAALSIGLRIPGQPDSLLLGQILFIGFSIPQFLMRKLPYQLAWTELEYWFIVLTLVISQVYMRNPVGLNLFGGDVVGGKPYILFIISLLSSLLLVGLKVPPSELKWILRLSILGGLMNQMNSILGRISPTFGYYTGSNYARTDEVNYEDSGKAVDAGAATRDGTLTLLGSNLSLWICSFKSPLKAILHPLWGTLILLSITAATLSGYRNAVVMLSLSYFVGLCYRGGLGSIMFSSVGGILLITLLAIVNTITPLPPNIQRSLSFLPGTWEKRYVLDGENSSEWRLEMWKEVLMTDRWIQNKWLGDGLGLTARELQYALSQKESKSVAKGMSGFDAQREGMLANGNYHSGPVQTIRVVGYIGLAIMLLFQIRLAMHAHRQIQRCRGTEWFPLALLIGIPLIWNPVFFVFVFGEFKTAASTLLLGASMIRILENNLPIPILRIREKSAYLMPIGVGSTPVRPRLVTGRSV
ncbi:MAG: hypothetical protein ORN51_15080 [Akkermansiaceae bacterium]|nr:hypothetical protein [Akkermansiaceae bacterium]